MKTLEATYLQLSSWQEVTGHCRAGCERHTDTSHCRLVEGVASAGCRIAAHGTPSRDGEAPSCRATTSPVEGHRPAPRTGTCGAGSPVFLRLQAPPPDGAL